MTAPALPSPAAAPALPGPRTSRWSPAPVAAFRRDPLAFVAALARAHGDVAALRVGPLRFVLLSHPELVRDVLVTHHRRFTGLAFEATRRIVGDGLIQVQGERHRRQRRLVQPAFHRDRLGGYGETMLRHARRWRDAQAAGDALPVREAMMQLTLGVVGETMFGADELGAADDVRALIDGGLRLFGPLTLPLARWLERLPLPAARAFVRARARVDARVHALIAARRRALDAGAEPRGDLLDLLLLAHDDEGGPALDDRQLRDEIVTIVLAGHETTASALTWCWWMLATHPDAERRLHAELDAVLGGREPTVDDLPRLPYTAAVFAKTLRLWPVAPMMFRRALEDHPVRGWTVPRGTIVVVSPWVTQRDPRWWPEPEAFRPERWLRAADGGDAAGRPRMAWFPFGGGPRVCIGEHFATMEGALLLATIAQRWRLAAEPGGLPPLDATVGLRPPEALRMRLVARAATA